MWLGKGHQKIAIKWRGGNIVVGVARVLRIEMANDILEQELLCGIKIDDKSGNIIDKLNDLSDGYSFIHNKLNGFETHKSTLLEKIEEDPRIARQFIGTRLRRERCRGLLAVFHDSNLYYSHMRRGRLHLLNCCRGARRNVLLVQISLSTSPGKSSMPRYLVSC